MVDGEGKPLDGVMDFLVIGSAERQARLTLEIDPEELPVSLVRIGNLVLVALSGAINQSDHDPLPVATLDAETQFFLSGGNFDTGRGRHIQAALSEIKRKESGFLSFLLDNFEASACAREFGAG